MTSYAVGILKRVSMGPPVVEYLQRIDATLAPYDGHFIVHGGEAAMLEGTSPGTLIRPTKVAAVSCQALSPGFSHVG